MRDPFVADASVGIAWVIGNQGDELTNKALRRATEGAEVQVPALWYFEVANGLLVAVRRKLISEADRLTGINSLHRLNVARDDEGADEAMLITSELAEGYGLTVYDAAYLELAKRKLLPLATRDKALRAAAQKSGVSLL